MTFSARILLLILGLFILSSSKAQTSAEAKMLARATPYFAGLGEAVELVWEDAPSRSVFASQIEKESLWNPRAELCVPKPSCSRERGIGFGQMTITPKFNVFQEVGVLHPALRNWKPDRYFDPTLQLIAVVAKDRQHFKQCIPLMRDDTERIACMLSSYNGGFGGFSSDRRLCSNTSGCDPRTWYGGIEHTSLKAKTAQAGYGQSFFQINRGYVREVWLIKRGKYVKFLDEGVPAPAVAAVVLPAEVVKPKVAESPLAAILPNADTKASIAANPGPLGAAEPVLPGVIEPVVTPQPLPDTRSWLSRLLGRKS